MKKLLIMLILPIFSYSQLLKWNDDTRTSISIIADSRASIKEKGLNIGAEINYIQKWGYIHTGIQTFTVLEGGYYDWTTGGGIVLKHRSLDFYAGARLGIILRESSPFPLFGAEAGTDFNLGKFVLGLRATQDYRYDFSYSGAEPGFRFSGFVKLGYTIMNK